MTNVTVNVGVGGYWGDGTWGQNPWGEAAPITAINGFISSAGWGGGTWGTSPWGEDLIVNVVSRYSVTGVGATGGVGSVTTTGTADVPPTGLQATAQVGTLSPSVGSGAIARFDGWGRGTWGEAAWGTSLGLFATGQVGQLSYVGGVDVPASGLEATTSVGSVSITTGTGVDADVTGLEVTASVGSVSSVTGDANVNVTGIAPVGQVGTVTAKGIALINLTGLSATGQVTVPAVNCDASVSVTGVGTSGEVGSVLVWDRIDPDATVVWTEIAA